MAIYRLTFFFEQGENGWSESIHTTATTTAQLINLVQLYSQKRMAFAHPNVQMNHIRISDDLTYRDVILDPIALPFFGQFASSPKTLGPAPPFVALDLTMQTSPIVTRHMFLRGIPQPQTYDVQPNFSAAYSAALQAFVAMLLAQPFAIKNKDRTQVKQPIASITAGGVVTLSAPLGSLPVGPPLPIVQILGIHRSIIPVRQYQVSNIVSNSQFTLRNYTGPASGAVGYIRLVNYVLTSPIIQAVIDTVTERRVGRPFGQQRGRRAVVR